MAMWLTSDVVPMLLSPVARRVANKFQTRDDLIFTKERNNKKRLSLFILATARDDDVHVAIGHEKTKHAACCLQTKTNCVD